MIGRCALGGPYPLPELIASIVYGCVAEFYDVSGSGLCDCTYQGVSPDVFGNTIRGTMKQVRGRVCPLQEFSRCGMLPESVCHVELLHQSIISHATPNLADQQPYQPMVHGRTLPAVSDHPAGFLPQTTVLVWQRILLSCVARSCKHSR